MPKKTIQQVLKKYADLSWVQETDETTVKWKINLRSRRR